MSRRVRAALAGAARAGAAVVVATARPPRWISAEIRSVASSGFMVCANGALVARTCPWRVLDETTISADDASAVVHAVRRLRPGSSVAVEYPDGADREATFAGSRAPETQRAADRGRLVPDRPALKLLIQDQTLGIAALAALVCDVAPPTVHVTSSGLPSTVEVGPATASKATALQAICARFGISAAEVVAFGDMPNDAEMLSWAGWGVAVHNADPGLLERADEVTSSVDDDGVAVVLERLFPVCR